MGGVLEDEGEAEDEAAEKEHEAEKDELEADFKVLDADGNGKLSVEELKAWESGEHDTQKAMNSLIRLADKDGDLHVTAAELEAVRTQLDMYAAERLQAWAEHHEL